MVPVDEASVAAARAEHQAAGGASSYAVRGSSSYAASTMAGAASPVAVAAAPAFTYTGPLNLNTELVGHSNGAMVPVDEASVAAARVEHHAAGGASSYAVGGGSSYAAGGASSYAASTMGVPASPVAVADAPAFTYTGPLNLNTELVGHFNGALVPVDEASVAAARVEHLASGGASSYAA